MCHLWQTKQPGRKTEDWKHFHKLNNIFIKKSSLNLHLNHRYGLSSTIVHIHPLGIRPDHFNKEINAYLRKQGCHISKSFFECANYRMVAAITSSCSSYVVINMTESVVSTLTTYIYSWKPQEPLHVLL